MGKKSCSLRHRRASDRIIRLKQMCRCMIHCITATKNWHKGIVNSMSGRDLHSAPLRFQPYWRNYKKCENSASKNANDWVMQSESMRTRRGEENCYGCNHKITNEERVEKHQTIARDKCFGGPQTRTVPCLLRYSAVAVVRETFCSLREQENGFYEASIQMNQYWCLDYSCEFCNYWFMMFTWRIGLWFSLVIWPQVISVG